jgi:hypothetical protein
MALKETVTLSLPESAALLSELQDVSSSNNIKASNMVHNLSL